MRFTLTTTILFVAVNLLAQSARADGGKHLSEAMFGSKWPLTVSSGIVRCTGLSEVLFETGGKTYAVNGLAKGFAEKNGWLRIDSIWMDSPDTYEIAKQFAKSDEQGRSVEEIVKAMGGPTKIDIGPILDTGVALCR